MNAPELPDLDALLAGMDLESVLRALEEASANEGGTDAAEAEKPRRKRTTRPRALHKPDGTPMQVTERTERRQAQRRWEGFYAGPEAQAVLREIRRKRERRRWPGAPLLLVDFLCGKEGREKGGRPPAERRCTKRLGSRLCWNWRTADGDRCHLHPRA